MSSDTEVVERTTSSIKVPKYWKVLLLNDDVTTMEIVVYMLANIFNQSEKQAKAIMLEVHHKGAGVAGVYPHEVAEQKAADATAFARANSSPLVIKIEEDN